MSFLNITGFTRYTFMQLEIALLENKLHEGADQRYWTLEDNWDFRGYHHDTTVNNTFLHN